MKWLFRLAFRGQYQQIHHMRNEIAWLRSQMERERARADQAVDQLLMLHIGGPGITPAPARMGSDGLPDAFRDPELMAMGSPEGV